MLSPSRLSTSPRLLRLVVALLVLAPVVAGVPVARPAAAAEPAACDANGDGVSSGVVGEVFSNGSDEAARRLEADTGRVLDSAPRAHRYRVAVCVEQVDDGNPATDDRRVSVTKEPVLELRPEAAAEERSALSSAVDDLKPLLYRPGPRTSPSVLGVQVIGLEMWLAVDPATWVPLTATAGAGDVDVTATATPSKMVFEFSDGVVRVCDGPGVQYSPGAPGPAPCGREFQRTSDVQPVSMAVSIEYAISWTSTIGGKGTLVQRGEPNRYELVVGEVQTYLTDGRRGADPAVPAPPLPESSQPADDDDCSWDTPFDCSPSDIVDGFTDLAADAAWAALPEPVKDALQMVMDFLKGCARFVGDVLGSIQKVFAEMGQLITDTQGFIEEKLNLARSMFEAIKTDAPGFAREFLDETFELDLLDRNPAEWAGKIGCELAVGILTGGAAAGARFTKAFGDVTSFMRRVADWLRRRDGDGGDGRDGDDNGGTACPVSSFPSGTLVLLADGDRRPIEAVHPGDLVLAFDSGGGTWAPRPVLAQWSYLDTDEMATVRLADGSAVSSTDHHRFWSGTRSRFTEADRLAPGERLTTPAGPVSVDSVSVWPSGPTRVWELTVAVDHTFAVLAGPHALAVHNRCDAPPSPDAIDDALTGAPDLEGITRADVEDAWSRYTGTDDPASLPQDIGARRMSNDGNAYETQVRNAYNLTKNNEAFPPGGTPQFIPDAVPKKAPLHFAEVKRYETTPLQPSSNAGDQIRYLQQWARDNPGQTPKFDLYISNQDMISDSFQDLIDEAGEKVDITVTEIRPA